MLSGQSRELFWETFYTNIKCLTCRKSVGIVYCERNGIIKTEGGNFSSASCFTEHIIVLSIRY